MKRNYLKIGLLAMILSLLITACGNVVTDDMGAEIKLKTPAKTIVSISPNLTEILFAVGAGDRLVGRDSNSQYPEGALEAADLGAMWDGIPVEDILALEPDLILAGEIF
ncbi:MAG: ABC transporter substrate-binding protein, partial [Anaerolineales bacterium]|nr:ABC transporter substrate-binding protein [Anaerolineales bacterium]